MFPSAPRMYHALSPFTGQYAYVIWIAGLIVLGFTLVQKLRAGGPRPRLPRPTAAQVSTMVAWLFIAFLAWLALSRLR
jgi:hypothetical protein